MKDKPVKVHVVNPVGFAGLLTIAFIVLKLCDQIDWGWFWVCCPMIFKAVIVSISELKTDK